MAKKLSASELALLQMLGQNAKADEGMLVEEPEIETSQVPTAQENQAVIQEQALPQVSVGAPKVRPMNNSELRQKYQEALEADIAAQEENVRQQDALLRENLIRQQASQGDDYSNLLNFVDATYGTKYRQGYKAPAQEDQTAQLLKMLQESKRSVTGARTNALKALLEDERSRASEGREKRGEDRFGYTIQKDFKTDLDKNVNQPAQEINKDFSQIDSALEPKNGMVDLRDVNLVLSQYAKTVAGLKGVLSDSDIRTISLSNLETKLADLQKTFGSDAKVDAKIFDPWRNQVSVAKKASEEGFKRALDNRAAFYSDPSFVGGKYLFQGKDGGIAGKSLKESYSGLEKIFSKKANAAPDGMVTITDGKQVLAVPLADLEAAKKEGFKEVK